MKVTILREASYEYVDHPRAILRKAINDPVDRQELRSIEILLTQVKAARLATNMSIVERIENRYYILQVKGPILCEASNNPVTRQEQRSMEVRSKQQG